MGKARIIFFIAGLIFCLSVSPAFASEIEAESKIVEVMVYPDSALVGRLANLRLNAGEYKVIFSNIIPDIDENSLRVSGGAEEGVKILGVQIKKEFLEEEAQAAVRQLNEEIQKLQDEVNRLEKNKMVLSEEKQFLDSIRLFSSEQIPKDLITKIPPVKDLGDTLGFLDAKLKDNYAQVIDLDLQIREISKKIDVLRRKLGEVSGSRRKLKRSIVVDLESEKSAAFDLKVSYLVRGASWDSLYDARANFDKSEVELVSYGMVRQVTGEDWQGVDIYLSTAKPAIGGRMPYVAPWFLRPYQPPRVMESRAALKDKKMSMQYEAFDAQMALPSKPEQAEVEKYAKVEERGIAVVYKLPKKASVKSDGTEHKLPVSAQILAAKFEYSSYPRAVLNAYLGSRVTNAPNLQLLGGRVNIFLEGDFVGTSSIDNIGPGEEFDLYLGADENVKVKREQIEKKVDETLIAGIPSANRRTTFKYKLTVESYKSKKINVKLFEAMPIPEDDRIRVKIEKTSIEPTAKDWKDRKGIWLWEIGLQPKEKKEIVYTYIVEHPRDMQIEGLSSIGATSRYAAQVAAYEE